MNSTCELGDDAAHALKPYPDYKDSRIEWLGEVPKHWQVRRLKTLCSRSALYGANVAATSYATGGVRFLRTTDITEDGQLNGRGVFLPQESVDNYLLADGDVLISRSGTIGRSFLYERRIHGPCAYAGYLVRFVPAPIALPKYIFLFTKTHAFAGFLRVKAISSTIENVNGEKYANCPLPLPPHSEQAAIVRFLDHADRRIRRYIRAKQQLIALLEEQKQALIHQAVTGQIDVRTGRPFPAYKPSGVEWLGEVPERWQVCRSKRMFRPRRELARPNDIQLSATQAYGVISQRRYEERVGRKVVRILRHLEKRRHVEVDDFVMSMRSFQGGLERAWESGCIRSSYIVLRPATKLVVGYFGYLFKSAGYINALRSTANFIRDGQDLNFENYCRVDLPLPAIEEQQRIAQFLEQATTAIRLAVERYRGQVDLIREYRTRLIADVVTGKLDVQAAARLLDEVEELEPLDEADALIDGEEEPTDALATVP